MKFNYPILSINQDIPITSSLGLPVSGRVRELATIETDSYFYSVFGATIGNTQVYEVSTVIAGGTEYPVYINKTFQEIESGQAAMIDDRLYINLVDYTTSYMLDEDQVQLFESRVFSQYLRKEDGELTSEFPIQTITVEGDTVKSKVFQTQDRLDYSPDPSELENDYYSIPSSYKINLKLVNNDKKLNDFIKNVSLGNRAELSIIRLGENEPAAGKVASIIRNGTITEIGDDGTYLNLSIGDERSNFDFSFLRKGSDLGFDNIADELIPVAYGRNKVKMINTKDDNNRYIYADPDFSYYNVNEVFFYEDGVKWIVSPSEYSTDENGIIRFNSSRDESNLGVDFTSTRAYNEAGNITVENCIIDLVTNYSVISAGEFDNEDIDSQRSHDGGFDSISFYLKGDSLLSEIEDIIAGSFCYFFVNSKNKYTIRKYNYFPGTYPEVEADLEVSIMADYRRYASEVKLNYAPDLSREDGDSERYQAVSNNQYATEAIKIYKKSKTETLNSILTNFTQAQRLADFLSYRLSRKPYTIEMKTNYDLTTLSLYDIIRYNGNRVGVNVIDPGHYRVVSIEPIDRRLKLRYLEQV